MFKSYNPEDQSIRDRHQMLIGSIGPRPIALTPSINTKNELNLAPFSFHNILSSCFTFSLFWFKLVRCSYIRSVLTMLGKTIEPPGFLCPGCLGCPPDGRTCWNCSHRGVVCGAGSSLQKNKKQNKIQ